MWSCEARHERAQRRGAMKPLASLSAARLGYSRRAWRTKPVDLRIMPAASGGHALLGNNGHGKTLLSQALLHNNAS